MLFTLMQFCLLKILFAQPGDGGTDYYTDTEI